MAHEISVSFQNLYILGTNTQAQSNCIFCESRFLVILICIMEYHIHMETYILWLQILGPNPIVFLRIQIFSNLDLRVGISFPYGNHYSLITNIEAQSSCIFCESWFLIILICFLVYYIYLKIYILATNIVTQPNCILWESTFLLSLMCFEISFP